MKKKKNQIYKFIRQKKKHWFNAFVFLPLEYVKS
jgi:hypothetical protein